MKLLLLTSRVVICTIMVAVLFGLFGASSSEAAYTCETDVQGKDDQPGQKDLTKFCRGLASDLASCTADFAVKWNWDVTALSGNNTGDACALFDTDNDGFANYALCVTIEKSPARQALASPRLYLCDNTRSDRCPGGAQSQQTGFLSTCSVAITATDPFNAGGSDTTASCCIDLDDFDDPTAAILLDVCSFPSQQPNSAPSDCIVTVECTTDSQCNDNDVCTNDVCRNGVCTHTIAEGHSCDDGNACTSGDSCDATGQCVGGTSQSCAATDQCHLAGTCNPTDGTCSNPAAPDGTGCNDGDACTQTDQCQSGICTGGNPKVCTPLDQCHVAGTCDPATGVCSNPNAANGTGCNDGNACTTGEACTDGACGGGTETVCTALDQCHVAGTCNPATGGCSNPNAPDNTPCSDGNQCTVGDKCVSGVCQPGANTGNVPG